MGEIYNLFSTQDPSPQTFTLERANKILPLIKKFTEQAAQESEKQMARLQFMVKGSPEYERICKEHDDAMLTWAERIQRLGGQPKGLWLVDFDTGQGFLCWKYPEERIDHFHAYNGSYHTRTKIV